MLPWQPLFASGFFRILNFQLVNAKSKLFLEHFTFLERFLVNLLIFSTLDQFGGLKVLEKSRNSSWQIQDGCRLRTRRYCDVM